MTNVLSISLLNSFTLKSLKLYIMLEPKFVKFSDITEASLS